MKRYLIFTLILSISLANSFSFARPGDMDYINRIEDKKITTFDDGLVMTLILLGKSIPRTFHQRLNFVKKNKCLPKKFNKKKGDKLYRGDLSLMIVRCLDLKGSFLYWVFGGRRYSMRLLVHHNLMRPLQSEWDGLSGEELIEAIRMASEYRDAKKVKR